MEQARSLIEGFIVGAPFARVLGVVVDRIDVDRVRLTLPYRDDVTTIGDLVHGGAIAGLVDVAATAACWASPDLDPNARGTTIGFAINYLNAGRAQDLIADAEVIQRGRAISVADVHVRSADGTLVARATVTYKLNTGGRG